jgi:hypothetical protein
MRITQKFHDKLELAKKKGFKRVYVVIDKYMSTTYCHFIDIDELLNMPIGSSYNKPPRYTSRWAGHPNTRQATSTDIKYSEVLNLQ